MKILRTVQQNYAILGISPSNQLNQSNPFNKRVLLGFLSFGSVIASQSVYIFHVDNGFMEHMDWICSISATVIQFGCFATIVFSKTTLFACIARTENLIDSSKIALFFIWAK